jgi:hypothetical protein
MADRETQPKKARQPAVPTGNHQATTDETETLNFKVKSQFKREYKGYAVSRGMTMVELLEASYQLYKVKHSG